MPKKRKRDSPEKQSQRFVETARKLEADEIRTRVRRDCTEEVAGQTEALASAPVKYVSIALALAALVTGLKAAWDWHLASKVDPLLFNSWDSITNTAVLNKKAALWTAITVVLGTIANMLSSFC
jgi:hypothetical protein